MNIYVNPPPLVNTGIPIKPINTYKLTAIVPLFGPSKIPDNNTKGSCNENGTPGKGIIILAPIKINEINSPINTK